MRSLILIIAIFTFGFLLRIYNWQNILFTYDQARDAITSKNILSGNLKIVGPPTDIPGVFHGPAYYYFLAPLYGLSNMTPIIPLIGIIFINLCSGLIFYWLVKKIFYSTKLGLLAFFLYTVSFEAINYGRWLSNPTMVIFSFLIFMAGLWLLIEKNIRGWLLVAIGLGLSIQFQLFMLYLFPVLFLFIIIFKPPLKKMFFPIALLIILLSSFVIAEFKFGFQGVYGLLGFFAHQSGSIDLISRFSNYFISFLTTVQNSFFPQNKTISILILLIFIILNINKSKISKFLLFIFIAHSLVFFISKVTLSFISVGIIFPVIILAIGAINKFRWSVILLPIIICANLIFWRQHPQSIFEVQPGMKYSDEIAVVTKSLELSSNDDFSINTITNPYRYPTLWAYHFSNYAKLPYYRGITTYSYVGDDLLPKSDAKRPVKLLIVEPEVGTNNKFFNEELAWEKSNIIGTYQIGKFILYQLAP